MSDRLYGNPTSLELDRRPVAGGIGSHANGLIGGVARPMGWTHHHSP